MCERRGGGTTIVPPAATVGKSPLDLHSHSHVPRLGTGDAHADRAVQLSHGEVDLAEDRSHGVVGRQLVHVIGLGRNEEEGGGGWREVAAPGGMHEKRETDVLLP